MALDCMKRYISKSVSQVKGGEIFFHIFNTQKELIKNLLFLKFGVQHVAWSYF